MVTATLLLSGIDMSEDEYRETLAHAKRFEFTNGVVTAKRGPHTTTQKSHVAIAEERCGTPCATARAFPRAARSNRQPSATFGWTLPASGPASGTAPA